MVDRDDCDKTYYLVKHSVDHLGDLVVSHSAYDKAVVFLDELDRDWFYMPTYTIEQIYREGVWISDDTNLIGSQIAIDCEIVEMIQIEKTEDQTDLPVGFRRVW